MHLPGTQHHWLPGVGYRSQGKGSFGAPMWAADLTLQVKYTAEKGLYVDAGAWKWHTFLTLPAR